VLGHDVGPARPAADGADVGRRLVVDAPQPHGGDRLGRSEDRAAADFGTQAGVSGGAVERGAQAVEGRRANDDLPDRRGMVEDEAERRAQDRGVERLGALQAGLLADGEQELDAHRRALDRRSVRERQQHCHRRLVVGAEDRVARALPAAVDQHRLDDAVVGHRVQVRAEHHPAIAAPRDPRQQVAALRDAVVRRVVLADLEAERPEVVGDAIGDRALVAPRARDRAELGEQVVQPAALDLRRWPHPRRAL
jgi:hypothetical protein